MRTAERCPPKLIALATWQCAQCIYARGRKDNYQYAVVGPGIQYAKVTERSTIAICGRTAVIRVCIDDQLVQFHTDGCSGEAVINGPLVAPDVARNYGNPRLIVDLGSNLTTDFLEKPGGQIRVCSAGVEQNRNGEAVGCKGDGDTPIVRKTNCRKCNYEFPRFGGAGSLIDRQSGEVALELGSIDAAKQNFAFICICGDSG